MIFQADPASCHSAAGLNGVLPDGSSHNSHKSIAASVASVAASAAAVDELERKMSFTDQDDFLPPISLLSHQRSFVYDDLIDDLKNGKAEVSIFSEEEGIADAILNNKAFSFKTGAVNPNQPHRAITEKLEEEEEDQAEKSGEANNEEDVPPKTNQPPKKVAEMKLSQMPIG